MDDGIVNALFVGNPDRLDKSPEGQDAIGVGRQLRQQSLLCIVISNVMRPGDEIVERIDASNRSLFRRVDFARRTFDAAAIGRTHPIAVAGFEQIHVNIFDVNAHRGLAPSPESESRLANGDASHINSMN